MVAVVFLNELNMKNNNFTAIDLFSGAGGLSFGLKKAGFKVLANVELDKTAADTYQLNHRKHIQYNIDIRKLNPEQILTDLKIEPGELDLLAGCPPCQGFSTHRTRYKSTSVDDERNDLINDFLRFVEILNPKTIMMENVPGLLKDFRMKELEKKLVELGYFFNKNSIIIKDVSDYGVPQRRRRMILQVSKFGDIEHPEKIKIKKTVRDAISNLEKPGKSGDVLHDLPVVRSERVSELIKLVPKNGGSRSELPKEYWLPCHIRRPGAYTDVYGRMSWDDVAPTITGGCIQPSKGRYIHPSENRAITLREAALLQTFPDNYKFSLKKGKDSVALMIGNALPPEFIRRHANMIKKHLIDNERLQNGI